MKYAAGCGSYAKLKHSEVLDGIFHLNTTHNCNSLSFSVASPFQTDLSTFLACLWVHDMIATAGFRALPSPHPVPNMTAFWPWPGSLQELPEYPRNDQSFCCTFFFSDPIKFDTPTGLCYFDMFHMCIVSLSLLARVELCEFPLRNVWYLGHEISCSGLGGLEVSTSKDLGCGFCSRPEHFKHTELQCGYVIVVLLMQ